ncbi:MAG TPA: TRAP transporter small permease subunit [Syntrophales bacterium]|nr:TRAP transporter small permease subunit [Syntrophales bacterium]
MNILQDSINRLHRWFDYFETWIIIILAAFVIGFGLIQIILRNVFSTGLVWGDVFLKQAVLWICMLGAARAAGDDKHIHIDILPRLLPEKLCVVVRIITNALSVIVCAILVSSSWAFVQNDRLAGDMAFASIPLWWLELVFPFSFAVMTIRFANSMFSALTQCREGMRE